MRIAVGNGEVMSQSGTTGSNTVSLNGATITGYQAGPGWDPVTGWGTPDAQVLIPLLAR